MMTPPYPNTSDNSQQNLNTIREDALAVDEQLASFHAADGTRAGTLYGDWALLAFSVSPDQTRLVLCGGEARIFTLPVLDDGVVVADRSEIFTAFAFSPDGKLLAVGTSKELRLWDVNQGAVTSTLPLQTDLFRFSPDGTEFVLSDISGKMQRCKLDGTVIEELADAPTRPQSIVWSPDGRRVLVVGLTSGIRIWDVRD